MKSLGRIDDDGQELRYATNRDGKRSLDDLSIVNLGLIRESIGKMGALLVEIRRRIEDLEEERATGTHTAECSKADLAAIADILGDRSTWVEQSFHEKRKVVMERFGLASKKKFSATINAIRASRPLATKVGHETPLVHLSDDKAEAALRRWAQAHTLAEPTDDDLGTEYDPTDRSGIFAYAAAQSALDRDIERMLTIEEFADLETVFYLGRNREHGEHYEDALAGTLAKHAVGRRWNYIHNIMCKTNVLPCFITGARAVGRPSLAERLRTIRGD